MAELIAGDLKLVRYLNEAYARERELETARRRSGGCSPTTASRSSSGRARAASAGAAAARAPASGGRRTVRAAGRG